MKKTFQNLAIVILGVFSFSSLSIAQRKSTPGAAKTPVKSTVGIGIYEGNSRDTITSRASPVRLSLTEFERLGGNVAGTLDFVNESCAESLIEGLSDDTGVTFSSSMKCSPVDRNLVARCSFVGADKMNCTYTAKSAETARVIGRGSFKLDRSVTRTVSTSTVIYQDRPVAISPPKKKYSVSFPTTITNLDLAMVNTDGVTIRSSASATGPTLSNLSPRRLLALVDRNPVNGMLRVIDYETGVEAWVSQDDVEIRYSTSETNDRLLERTPGSSGRDPTVYIKNDSDRIITLGFGGQTYTIGPSQSKTLEIRPGRYKYYVSSPKVLPMIGDEYLEAGFQYSWTFYLERRIVDR